MLGEYLEAFPETDVSCTTRPPLTEVTFIGSQQMRGVSGRKLCATLTVVIASEIKLHSNADVSAW
jgi:hypothetical protein